MHILNKKFEKIKPKVCGNTNKMFVDYAAMNTNKKDQQKQQQLEAFKRLNSVLVEKNINHVDFLISLGVKVDSTTQNWNHWKGERGMPHKYVSPACDKLGLNYEWLATGKGAKYKTDVVKEVVASYNATKIKDSNAKWLGGFDLWDGDTPLDDDEVALPFFREVELSAGSGISEVQENHGRKLRFAKKTLRDRSVRMDAAYCVTVNGNSMEPAIPNGATIGINTDEKNIENGKVYAIDHHGELRVKVLYKMPGGLVRVRSFNSDEYPDETHNIEIIKVLGRMFWCSYLC